MREPHANVTGYCIAVTGSTPTIAALERLHDPFVSATLGLDVFIWLDLQHP